MDHRPAAVVEMDELNSCEANCVHINEARQRRTQFKLGSQGSPISDMVKKCGPVPAFSFPHHLPPPNPARQAGIVGGYAEYIDEARDGADTT